MTEGPQKLRRSCQDIFRLIDRLYGVPREAGTLRDSHVSKCNLDNECIQLGHERLPTADHEYGKCARVCWRRTDATESAIKMIQQATAMSQILMTRVCQRGGLNEG